MAPRPEAGPAGEGRTLDLSDLTRVVRGAVVATLVLATLRLLYVHAPIGWGPLDVFQSAFDVDAEQSIPTWLSTMLLAMCAAAAATVGVGRSGADRRGWFGLAGFVLLLSIDESASFHERVGLGIEAGLGGAVWHWVFVGTVMLGVVVVLGHRWLATVPPSSRRAIVLAGVLFVSGALVVEAGAGALLEDEATFAYGLSTLLEEGLEMFGAVVLLSALVRLIALDGPVVLRFGSPPGDEDPRRGTDGRAGPRTLPPGAQGESSGRR